jgi:NADH dehydrogenase [ubiquinone] 1 alpha subcomplex assembly factor 7
MKAKDTINRLIKQQGFIKVDMFMKIGLSSCEDSYYINRDPLGIDRDFITAPEISQMFGEMMGIWAVDKWIKMGMPKKINLVELGPGKGSLIRDLLNITKHVIGFHNSIDIYMFEINQKLVKVQKKLLQDYEFININWVTDISEIPQNHTIMIGNEFFDSLPIKQFIFNQKWKERVIILDQSGELKFSEIDITNSQILDHLNIYKSIESGGIVEYSEEAENYIKLIKKFIAQNLSYCLLIDYGYYIDPGIRHKNQYNSTLQAIQRHKFVDIFHDIGNSDMTSHVDFYMLSNFIRKAGFKINTSIISQSEFLKLYRINERLKTLSKNQTNLVKLNLEKQYNRLTDKRQMGDLFKVIEFYTD